LALTSEGLPAVRVHAEANPVLFAAFALLNATNYNAENGWRFSATREAVRLSLSSRGEFWRERLSGTGLLETLHRSGGALLMDVVPAFSVADRLVFTARFPNCLATWQAESKRTLAGIEEWLPRFFREERIDGLWTAHQEAYSQAVGTLEAVAPVLADLAARFGHPTELEVLLWPNLLDARRRGYSLSEDRRTWLFLGPVQDQAEAEALATHELLHRWVDPVAERIAAAYPNPPMAEARARFRVVADYYAEPAIWVGETVVRALSVRESARSEELVGEWEDIGFLGIKEVVQFLSAQRERPHKGLIDAAVRLACDRALAAGCAA
jgi:hypothetical protein